MYYWTKVDLGDRDEVLKILQFARQNFAKDNEFFEIVNCTNSDGFTPLHLASSEGHANMIDVLIKAGAQVDARTNNFRTPLHIACLRGNLNVIQTLVANGADINAKDIESNTPCHFVSEYGHRLCLKYLLERNPYLFANNNEDKSAIDVAISSDILNEFQQFIEKSKDFSRDRKKKPAAHNVVGDTGGNGTVKKDKDKDKTGFTSSSEPERGVSPAGQSNSKRSGNSAGQGSGSGVNSSSDGRTGNTSSRLSQRTKMINQVAAT